ncbi:MAG: rhomboid family intramembrane serine protease [Moheibacter sp.]
MSFLTLKTPIKATAFLILLNLMVFVIMIFLGINIVSPTGKELLEIGANRRTEVINGEYWRLITSMFIHGGLNHLILNLFALVVSGFLLESEIRKYKFLFVYFVSGIFAGIASIYWHNNSISVGASGAIFGLYGVMLAFNLFKIYPANMRNMVWTVLGMFAGVSLLLGLLPGIDNAAHIGGLISGFIIGVIWISIDKEKLIEDGFK